MELAEIVHLEEASLNGLPALKTQFYDGWILRMSNGYTRRANSVVPLFHSTHSLDEKIDYCESTYAQASLPCIFKLTPASYPQNLDKRLEELGYTSDAETLVQMAPLNFCPEKPATVRLFEAPDGPFIQTWEALSPRNEQIEILKTLLKHIATPSIYAVAYQGETAVGYARAALTGNFLGLFDLLVAPDYRNRGLGKDLVNARLWWAYKQGAKMVYLQVMENNLPARNLQGKFEFRESYRYWYRVQSRAF